MKYRAEIDGLRAIAVIPVILFHAGFEQFNGGFVGVDVFFVISGYLITTIILSEKEQGTFSLINFYERRARRILPALFLVMLFSLPFAWFWLLPSDLKDFSQSLVAVSIFSSNILFWQESGYWGTINELKPLLHTWSLAVEEQYYIVFPLFLMLMWRFRKRWILSSFIILAIMSLFFSQWSAYNKPIANFFLLPTRAWELAIGASIAFYFLYKKNTIRILLSHKIIDELMGAIGLFLILYAVFIFNENVPFPSFYALVPTVGAGLIILFSSHTTWVGRLLGAKIPVGIGLISYSAYLWHQPLFAFARHRSITEPNEAVLFVLALVTIPLAYLSWKYVEKPFRSREVFSRKAIFIFSLSGSIIFISIGLAGYFSNGFNIGDKNKLVKTAIEEKLKSNYGLSKVCEREFTLATECRTSKEPEILVWGDSYAMHLVPGIVASSPTPKIIQMTKSGCGPFFDIAPVSLNYPLTWAKGCLKFTMDVRQWIKENKTIKYVVISSPFVDYLFKENKLLRRDGGIVDVNTGLVLRELTKTLDDLRSMGVIPVVFSPPPATGIDLGRCLAKAEWMGINLDVCDFNINKMSKSRKNVYNLLESIQGKYNVVRLDHLLCDKGRCKTHINSTWIFRDVGHFSNSGSITVGKKFDFYSLIINNK